MYKVEDGSQLQEFMVQNKGQITKEGLRAK